MLPPVNPAEGHEAPTVAVLHQHAHNFESACIVVTKKITKVLAFTPAVASQKHIAARC
jgi:hypothetical protein